MANEKTDTINMKQCSHNILAQKRCIRYEKMRQAKLGAKNPMFGKKRVVSPETREKLSFSSFESCKRGNEHCRWKGEKVGYKVLHAWLNKYLPKPEFCEMCKEVPPYDLANITGRYTRDPENWAYYCRRCHMISDGRMDTLKRGLFRGKKRNYKSRKKLV